MIKAQIEAIRPQVDYVLVAFHWGHEYHLDQNEDQRKLGQIAIDAGADAIIGHHPHWLQGVELYQGKPIIYSLGNFVFDQDFGGWVNEGAVAVIILSPYRGLEVTFVPVEILNLSTPRFANRWKSAVILERMASVSTILEP